jgi:hypothetical protein
LQPVVLAEIAARREAKEADAEIDPSLSTAAFRAADPSAGLSPHD